MTRSIGEDARNINSDKHPSQVRSDKNPILFFQQHLHDAAIAMEDFMKHLMLSMTIIMVLAAHAEARGRKPCSGKMGGVSHCSGGKFVCKNGQISRSTRTCSREG